MPKTRKSNWSKLVWFGLFLLLIYILMVSVSKKLKFFGSVWFVENKTQPKADHS